MPVCCKLADRGVTIHCFCNSNQFKSQSFVIKSNQFTSDHNAKIDQFKSIQITRSHNSNQFQVFESDLKWFANQLRKNPTSCIGLGAENSITCVYHFGCSLFQIIRHVNNIPIMHYFWNSRPHSVKFWCSHWPILLRG